MSNTRNTGFLTNIIQYTPSGNISFVSGSTTLMSISSSGAITTTGVISGSTALSASNALSSSYSLVATTATTASSISNLNQNVVVTGSLTTTGQIVAQTLNVQQVTSSIVYSSGSNIFGNSSSNTQQMTGSLLVTGSGTFSSTLDGTIINSTSNAFRLNGNNALSLVTLSGQSVVKINAAGFWGTQLVGANDKGILIDNSGNVGIGVTSLRSWDSTLMPIEIGSTGNFYAGFNGGPTNVIYLGANAYYNAGWKVANANSYRPQLLDAGGGNWHFQNAQTGSAGSAITWTSLMYIASSGNVGIGTSTPNGNLEVAAATPVIISGASSSGTLHGIEFRQSNTLDAYIKQLPATGEFRFYVGRNSSWGGNMSFYTDTVNRMSISSGGEVRITGAGSSSTAFSIYDGGSRRVFCIPSQYYGYILSVCVAADGGKAISIGNGGGAAEVGSIVANNASTTYNTTSDYRLKEDLKDFSGLDKVSAIKVYDFKWKTNEERTHGVIAHELEEVLPYAVHGEKDGLDRDGKPSYQGVDYSKIVPSLVKAVQELKAENDSLKEILQRNNIQ